MLLSDIVYKKPIHEGRFSLETLVLSIQKHALLLQLHKKVWNLGHMQHPNSLLVKQTAFYSEKSFTVHCIQGQISTY